jgi:hypothetical protein
VLPWRSDDLVKNNGISFLQGEPIKKKFITKLTIYKITCIKGIYRPNTITLYHVLYRGYILYLYYVLIGIYFRRFNALLFPEIETVKVGKKGNDFVDGHSNSFKTQGTAFSL